MMLLSTPLRFLTAKRAYFYTLFTSLFWLSTYHTSQAQWVEATSGTTQTLNSISYGGGQWIIVGGGGIILTSPDGITWTTRNSGTTRRLSGVSYGNGLWVAVGGDENPVDIGQDVSTILTSPDGITWTARTPGTIRPLAGISYAAGQWVAAGIRGTIVTSPDGITWTSQSTGYDLFDRLYGVSYNGTLWVVTGTNGIVATSPDGITWTHQNSATTNGLFGISYNGGTLVAVGFSGTIRTSPNGVNWTARTSGTTQILNAVSYGGDKYVAVGGTGTIRFSSDGITWSANSSGTNRNLNGIGYGGGTWVTVGDFGTIRYNTNPLPVSLISFQGQGLGASAHLNWQTAWENNASHFLVERSRDAKSFEVIGQVLAGGTTSQQQHYTFTDEDLSSGIYYYRLRQVDLDDSFSYSQIIGVRIGIEPLETLSIYPNPSPDQLILEDKHGINSVSIYSVSGDLLYQQTFEKPVEHWSWNGANHPAGTYLIRVVGGDGVSRPQRWVKQ